MRLANIDRDHWHLLPPEFEGKGRAIPEELPIGNSVELAFEIELLDEHNNPFRAIERMWVAVTEKIGNEYVGLLESEPQFPPDAENSLLVQFMEVPFARDCVINYLEREDDFRVWILSLESTRQWPKEYA